MCNILLFLLLAQVSSFTTPFEYTVEQATFVEAKSAIVIPQGDKVLIEAVELSTKQQPGLKLTIPNLTQDKIEVTRLITVTIDGQEVDLGVYPPQEISPSTDGIYRIVGAPGNRYGIRAYTSDGREQIFVAIDGEPSGPITPPPTTDLSSLKETVSSSVAALNDPVTQEYIKFELKKVTVTSVEQGIEATKNAIKQGLLSSMKQTKPPYKDWENGFRVPLNKEIAALNPQTPETLTNILVAIVESM